MSIRCSTQCCDKNLRGIFSQRGPKCKRMHRNKKVKWSHFFAAFNRSGIPPDKNIDVRSPQRGGPDLCFSPEERNVYAYVGPKMGSLISVWVIASLPAPPESWLTLLSSNVSGVMPCWLPKKRLQFPEIICKPCKACFVLKHLHMKYFG